MGTKARRRTKKCSKPTRTLRDDAEELFGRQLRHLEQVLNSCETSFAQGYTCECGVTAPGATPALVNSSANAARALATLSSEMRQNEKHVAQQVLNLTPEQEDEVLLDYLEEIEPARREKFLERLMELRGDSVLG